MSTKELCAHAHVIYKLMWLSGFHVRVAFVHQVCVCVLGRCKKKPQGNQVCGGEMHLLLNTFGAVWDAKIALRLCDDMMAKWAKHIRCCWAIARLIAIIKINWNLYFHPCATTSVCLSILSEFLHMYKTLSLRVAASSPHTPTKVKWKRCIIVQRWWCSTIYNIYIHICGSRTNLLPAPDHQVAIYTISGITITVFARLKTRSSRMMNARTVSCATVRQMSGYCVYACAYGIWRDWFQRLRCVSIAHQNYAENLARHIIYTQSLLASTSYKYIALKCLILPYDELHLFTRIYAYIDETVVKYVLLLIGYRLRGITFFK